MTVKIIFLFALVSLTLGLPAIETDANSDSSIFEALSTLLADHDVTLKGHPGTVALFQMAAIEDQGIEDDEIHRRQRRSPKRWRHCKRVVKRTSSGVVYPQWICKD